MLKKTIKPLVPKIILIWKKKISYFISLRKIWIIKIERGISINSVGDTFDILMARLVDEKPTVYMRFGDGDVNLLKGGRDRYHRSSKALSRELAKCFQLSGEAIVKCLPLHSKIYGFDEKMKIGVHLQSDAEAKRLLNNCFEFFVGSAIYSPVVIHYNIIYNKELALRFFRELKKHKPIFVGNKENDPDILRKVLGAETFIKSPGRDAFDDIERIEEDLVAALKDRSKDFDVVVLSCGVCAKVLSRRLYNKFDNLYIFDLGSVIDIFHGRDEWTWVKESPLESRQLSDFFENT